MTDSSVITLTVEGENLPQNKQNRRLDLWLSQQIPDLLLSNSNLN